MITHAAVVRSSGAGSRASWIALAGVALIAATVCNTGLAVDGYKDFKFGLSPEQVKKKCPVPLQELANDGWADTLGKDCRVLAAPNFQMMDAEREVNFVFNKRGLAIVIFILQAHEFGGVSQSLGEKYGGGALHPSPAEFQQIAKRFDAGQPNTTVKITFDRETVVLIGTRNETGEASFLLMYKAENADQQDISKRSKDDL